MKIVNYKRDHDSQSKIKNRSSIIVEDKKNGQKKEVEKPKSKSVQV